MNMRVRCSECKGRGMCGLPECPVMRRFHASLSVRKSDSYMGGAPSLFIGTRGYPRMNGGPLLIGESDDPPEWIREGWGIDEVVGMRAKTIRGTLPLNKPGGALEEIALSATPVDVEVAFARPVSFDLSFDGTLAPVGLSGNVKKMDVLENAKTPIPVDKVVSDTDLRAADAASFLYDSGIDVYHITRLLTAGQLGVRRRMVPTRWGITAVDNMLAAERKECIRKSSPLDEYLVFSGEVFGNRIVCILAPGDWRFEMIEIWKSGSLWGGDTDQVCTDGEGLKKRGYSPLAGAYYSARLAVADYLAARGRSARVIVIRTVSQEYWAPLGTWVVREAARKAMDGPPVSCESLKTAVEMARSLTGTDPAEWKSSLLSEMRVQKTLFEF